MNRLKVKYIKEVVPKMKELFGYKNDMTVPKIEKVVVNVGLRSDLVDDKYKELVGHTLMMITGQKPIITLAKKSIAGFKIRQGKEVGMKVTLRRERMYDFVDKIVSVVLPRVRDFRGLKPESLDKQGNLTIGFKEHLVFPEINPDEIEKIHGLEITITTTAKNREEGLKLLKLLGFPFKEK